MAFMAVVTGGWSSGIDNTLELRVIDFALKVVHVVSELLPETL